MMDGRGTLTFPSGQLYDGYFKDDEPEGYGWWRDDHGSIYDGNLKQYKRDGRGVWKDVNGDVYDGQWKDGKKDGRGKLIYANGDIYNGNWKDDKRDGRGVCEYSYGTVYDGNWVDDRKDGHGVWKDTNGDVYNGDWKHDKKDGRGMLTCANGDVYNGGWSNNLPTDAPKSVPVPSHPHSSKSASPASHYTSVGPASASSIGFVASQMRLSEGQNSSGNSIVMDGAYTAAHSLGHVLLKVKLLKNTHAAKAKHEYNMMHRLHHIAPGCFVRPSVRMLSSRGLRVRFNPTSRKMKHSVPILCASLWREE